MIILTDLAHCIYNSQDKKLLSNVQVRVMRLFFYCDKRSINDATSYYVDLIVKPLKEKGYEFKIVHALRDIHYPDIILTVTCKYFFCAKLKFPRCKTIYWAQGVSAAEARMSIKGIKSFMRFIIRAFTERIAVRRSNVLFCVSERMVQYYTETYHLRNMDKCIIMPCYNLALSDTFTVKQYETPTFVYAGGFNIWQGIDFMLDVYSRVEKAIPSSKLTILSNQKEQFSKAIEKYGIRHFEIKYVPLNQLSEELHKHKYGFIIRDNNIVNNVSTPTKMNSYLSNFLIPVFSDAVDSFVRHIDLGKYQIMVNCPLDAEIVAKKIVKFENTINDFYDYQSVVNRLFESYYNDDTYHSLIEGMYLKILFR